jgi:hypothetical protein
MWQATSALDATAPAAGGGSPTSDPGRRIDVESNTADNSKTRDVAQPEIALGLGQVLDERINRGLAIVGRERLSDGPSE